MEIRANYILVGAFTLLAFMGAIAFTLWTASQDKGVPQTLYDISFEDGVRGISVNGDVLFSGIRVGKITEIKISQVKPGAVRVRVAIAADTPVREDSRAAIETRGITGSSIISISGGTKNSPLKHVPEDAVGEIIYEPSPLDSVVSQMPDVLASANKLLHRLEELVSDENIAAVNTILASTATLTATLGDRAGTIDGIIEETSKAVVNFDKLIISANEAMTEDVKATSESLSRIASRLESTLKAMEPGLKQFSNQGLSDMRMLMQESRGLVHMLTRISQKLENDPRRFFFGDQVKEYRN